VIYLPNTTGKEKTFLDILNLLYDKEQSKYSLCSTYFDKECTQIECEASKRRSFQALVEIAKTYFPDITLDEICDAIKAKGLLYYTCHTIKKIVFHYAGTYEFYDVKNIRNDIPKVEEELEEFLDNNFPKK
jgi:hypothetical protein